MDIFESSDVRRAKELHKKAKDNPKNVPISEIEDGLEYDEVTVRRHTAAALAKVAETYPGDVRTAVDELHSLLTDRDNKVRAHAAYGLGNIAEAHPEDIRIAIDNLRALLQDDSEEVRAKAAGTLGIIAQEYPEDVRGTVGEFHSLLHDEVDVVQAHAVWGLRWISKEYPKDVLPMVDDIYPLLYENRDDTVQTQAAEIIKILAEPHPDKIEPLIFDLSELLIDETIREEIMEILTKLATHHPNQVQEALAQNAPELIPEIIDNRKETKRSIQDDYMRSESESCSPELNHQRIPDEIPSAPNIDCDYEKLEKGNLRGTGGNADVYHATFQTNDRKREIAIKEPHIRGTLHTELVDRFLQEAKTWQKLDNHNHVVEVVDYGSEPIPWIAMEYMDAGHLGQRAGEMAFDHALWTAIVITRAVRHAHRQGVAHLDLKPENVLFRSLEDAWDVPKVADWGLSKHLLEHSKSVEGISPHYAAPEQLDEQYGSADDITDIYQLGAVFYELFTGRPPFKGQTFKIINKIQMDTPTSPSHLAEVPPALDEILLQALATEKVDRYETVVNLRNDLQDVFESL